MSLSPIIFFKKEKTTPGQNRFLTRFLILIKKKSHMRTYILFKL